jgi:hypothetical protein
MKKSIYFFVLFFISFALISAQTTIESINSNPGAYNGDVVTVEGHVEKYVASHTSTSYYILVSDYGGKIKVNTSEAAPEVLSKYRVKGIVYIDPVTRRPFISEKSKILLNPQKSQAAPQQQNVAPPVNRAPAPPAPVKEKSSSNTIIYIIIGAIIIIILLIVVMMSKNKNEYPQPSYSPPSSKTVSSEATPASSGGATVVMPPTQKIETTSANDFKTIKITKSAPPKTLKFIPGKLVITNGEDKGKEFRIAGYPTPDGSIVSIGREEVKGDRSYAHIQLLQPTISRKQAEIISYGGNLYLKNLSETNLTQVDGIEVQPGQKVQLKPGSTIIAGEIEFKYVV